MGQTTAATPSDSQTPTPKSSLQLPGLRSRTSRILQILLMLRNSGTALRRFLARTLAYLSASERPPRPLPWRMLLRIALPLWLFTRALALILTAVSQTLLVASVAQRQRHQATIDLNRMVASWSLWDGHFYGAIVRHGYTASRSVNAGFWPLYPLLAKPFEALLGPTRWQIALLVTSNLALFAALVVLGALAIEDDETLGAARRAMVLLLAAPLALFLTAAYSDSLFLALACAALLCARRGQWRLVVLWAFLAALARPVGTVLLAPLAPPPMCVRCRCQWAANSWRCRCNCAWSGGGSRNWQASSAPCRWACSPSRWSAPVSTAIPWPGCTRRSR